MQQGAPVACVITKQPETIVIWYSKFSTGYCFVLFDSHPRVTNDNPHGAHVIYVINEACMVQILKQWLFPYNALNTTSLDELFNVCQCTILKRKPDAKWKPFLIESMQQQEELQDKKTAEPKVAEENELLKKKSTHTIHLLIQLVAQLEDTIKQMQQKIIALEKQKTDAKLVVQDFVKRLNDSLQE